MYTLASDIFAYVCDAALRQGELCSFYSWCCGYLDEIFPSSFKWLELMNEYNTAQTLQLFQTMRVSA